MVELYSLSATSSTTEDAFQTLSAELDDCSPAPAFITIFYDADHDDQTIFDFFRQRFPDAALLGGTSSGGIVTSVGHGIDDRTGVVTEAHGRKIISIDNEPASEVYNRWIGGFLSERLEEGGSVLAETTMHALGVDAGKIEDITHYLLVHPEKFLANGAVSTFVDIKEGTRIHAMRGDKIRLVERAGKVAAAAAASLPEGPGLCTK